MPREAIHWTVLSRVLKQLDRTPFSALFIPAENSPQELSQNSHFVSKRNLAALFLGAMAHDAPYYYRFGGSPFEAVAEELHGSSGNDTFDPFRRMALEILALPPADRPVVWSFLFGMVSHYAVDTIFHPLIYYFTGDYYDPDKACRREARRRHRLLETYLDSWVLPKLPRAERFSINGTIDGLGRGMIPVCKVLGRALPVTAGSDAGYSWRSALRYLGDLQAVFHSDTAGKVFRSMDRLLGGALSPIDALFIYGRREPNPLFDQTLKYRNPASGTEEENSAEELLELAVFKCLRLFELFAPLLAPSANETVLISALGGQRGESLNFGIFGAGYAEAKYFSTEGLPIEGLNYQRT